MCSSDLSATFPGNLILSSAQRDALADAGWKPNGVDVISTKRANGSAANGCNPPANLYLPEGIGGVDGCTYDYMRNIELYPESTKATAFGRGVLQLPDGHQAFAEVSLARARTLYSGTPNRIDVDLDVSKLSFLPTSALNALPSDDTDRAITVRTRLVEAGLQIGRAHV